MGLGSGMIMDSQGHILTNYHVVGNATEIKVLLSNGDRYRASLVGTDPKTDLAVIKIEAGEQLPHVTFGDSDKMDVGDWVIAIGHPRGLDQTVTQGIISAKHRRGITDPNSYQDFIQTDAAINPGNSGGPLLNLEGEVIAVNAAIISRSSGFEGIGFAIPINMALHVAKALIADGKVVRGWLGVNMQDLTPELAESFSFKNRFGAQVRQVTEKEAQKYGLEPDRGLIVISLDPDGPLGKVGFEIGDIILEVNSRSVPGFADLLDSLKPRDEVVFLALDHRTGQTGYVQVTVR